MDNTVRDLKELRVDGRLIAKYEIGREEHNGVLWLKMVQESFGEDRAIALISRNEKREFHYASYLNI